MWTQTTTWGKYNIIYHYIKKQIWDFIKDG